LGRGKGPQTSISQRDANGFEKKSAISNSAFAVPGERRKFFPRDALKGAMDIAVKRGWSCDAVAEGPGGQKSAHNGLRKGGQGAGIQRNEMFLLGALERFQVAGRHTDEEKGNRNFRNNSKKKRKSKRKWPSEG